MLNLTNTIQILVLGNSVNTYLTALTLRKLLAKTIKITILENPNDKLNHYDVAYHHNFINCLNFLGVNLDEFLHHTQTRIVGGFQHFLDNIYQESYTSFNLNFNNKIYPMINALPLKAAILQFNDLHLNEALHNKKNFALEVRASSFKKLFVGDLEQIFSFNIDAFQFLDVLKFQSKREDIEIIREKIEQVFLNQEKTAIHTLKLETQSLNPNYIFDSSGILNTFLQKHFNLKFISFKDNLIANSFLQAQVSNSKASSLNKIYANDCGFTTVNATAPNIFYTQFYNNNINNKNEALEDIKKINNLATEIANVENIQVGIFDKAFIANVFNIDKAYAHILSLENHRNQFFVFQLSCLVKMFLTSNNFISQNALNEYNQQMVKANIYIRDYQHLLHKLDKRSNFYQQQNKNTKTPQFLQEILEITKNRFLRFTDLNCYQIHCATEQVFDYYHFLNALNARNLIPKSAIAKDLQLFSQETINQIKEEIMQNQS